MPNEQEQNQNPEAQVSEQETTEESVGEQTIESSNGELPNLDDIVSKMKESRTEVSKKKEEEPKKPVKDPVQEKLPVKEETLVKQEKVEERPPESKVSKSLIEIARREKEIREKEKAFAAEVTELQEFRKLKTSAKENPMEALKSLGIDYETLTNHILEGDKPENKEIQKLRNELDEIKKYKEQEARQREQQVLDMHIESIRAEALAKEAERLELTLDNWEEAKDIYVELQRSYLNNDGKMAAPIDVLSDIEKFYEEKAERFLKSKKFSSKATPAKKQKEEETEEEEPKKKPVTLSSKQQRSSDPKPSKESFTEDDLMESALDTFIKARNSKN